MPSTGMRRGRPDLSAGVPRNSLARLIVIQTTRMDLLQDLPTASQGRVELHIARRDRAAVEKFVGDRHWQ